MILNDEVGGNTSDESFSSRTLNYAEYLQEEGLDPERYTIESWYEHPRENVPETEVSTMTGLSRQVLQLRE